MSTLGLIDTSILIAGIPAAVVNDIESYCSSAVCRGELVQGLHAFRADPARQHVAGRREELIRLLDAVPGFWRDFDLAASDGYGQLTAEPRSALRLKDALIAGHALSLRARVITGDPGFSRFTQLEVVLVR